MLAILLFPRATIAPGARGYLHRKFAAGVDHHLAGPGLAESGGPWRGCRSWRWSPARDPCQRHRCHPTGELPPRSTIRRRGPRTHPRDRHPPAIGARRRDILARFLTEATVLSIVGGLLGVAAGLALACALTHLTDPAHRRLLPNGRARPGHLRPGRHPRRAQPGQPDRRPRPRHRPPLRVASPATTCAVSGKSPACPSGPPAAAAGLATGPCRRVGALPQVAAPDAACQRGGAGRSRRPRHGQDRHQRAGGRHGQQEGGRAAVGPGAERVHRGGDEQREACVVDPSPQHTRQMDTCQQGPLDRQQQIQADDPPGDRSGCQLPVSGTRTLARLKWTQLSATTART